MADIKKRRITKKDWESVANFIKKTHETRKGGKFRKKAEAMWKEVDRQVAMESMARSANDPQSKGDWRAAIELGELSRASEVLSADIRRMAFPQNRSWFDPHIELDPAEAEAAGISLEELQQFSDGALRALMAQQQLDFGFKARTDLSIKEALHHGGYVAEVDDITMLGSMPDGRVGEITSPVWVPHSMWNCYPDDSPSVTTGTLFYTGSMLIASSMSHAALKGVKGDGWIMENINDLEDPKDKPHDLITYHGDVSMPRSKGDNIYLPNVKAIAIKDKLVYYKPNDLPFSRIIYNGYERLDVRNPYFISPLMKMSPTQKIASTMANKLIDSIELKNEPPIFYDGNDPDFVMMGGPDMSPRAKNSTKNMANFKVAEVGDPGAALTGLQFHISELQKGTSVDSIRSGMSSSTEQTATEVERTRQGGQIRTIDFLDKHELQGLRPYLYLHHESNKNNLKTYRFYNPEMDSPDFIVARKGDIPENVHFDVVGSKGMIEEDQRQQATMQVTQFAFSIGAGSQINIPKLMKEMYQDAGNKNPERFLNIQGQEDATQMVQQLQEQMQQIQEQAQQLQAENQELKQGEESKIQEIQAKASIEMAKQDNEEDQIVKKSEVDMAKIQADAEVKAQEADNKLQLEAKKLDNQLKDTMFKAFVAAETQPADTSEEDNEKKEESESIKMTQMMDKFEQMIQKFAEVSAAPKKVSRDKEGFITGITTEAPRLDS